MCSSDLPAGWADYTAPYPGPTDGAPYHAEVDEHPPDVPAVEEPAKTRPLPSPNDILNQLLSYAESAAPRREHPAPEPAKPEDPGPDHTWPTKPAYAQE